MAGSRIKGHDGKPELQIIISFNKPEDAVEIYRQRWQIETMFKAMKSAGFNIEAAHLSDIERIEKLLLIVMMAFFWCYNIGEFVHRNLRQSEFSTRAEGEKHLPLRVGHSHRVPCEKS